MNRRLAFIGGGQMAESLIRGILSAHLYPASDIYVSDPSAERCTLLEKEYGISVGSDNLTALQYDHLILAVKPLSMESVLAEIGSGLTPDHLVITIAAGLPLSFYARICNRSDLRLIRVMPNTPALCLAGASAIAAGDNTDSNDLNQALAIFNAVGSAVTVDESQLDAVTGLSGSGPAWVFHFIDGLISAGVEQGLARPVAAELVFQTVLGAVKLARESGEHPARLASRVCSPGGTTIAGVHVLNRAGFQGILMDCVDAATARSRQLGES